MNKKLAPIFILVCVLILSISTTTQAVEINDAGAKRLKDTLSTYIQEQKTIVTAKGGKLSTDGDIIIEQGNKYYAATLPAMTLHHGAGINMKFGLTAINAVPTDKDDSWKMSMAIPTPILITDEDNKNIGKINIKKQKMAGIWSPSLGSFSKLTAQYNGISFVPVDTKAKNEIIFNIGDMMINSKLDETKKDLWNGPSNLKMSDISLKDKKLNIILSLGSVNAKIDIKNYNRNAYKKAYSNLDKSADNNKNFGDNILNLLKASGEGNFKISLDDFKLQDTASGKNSPTSIDNIKFGGESSFSKNTLNQTLSFSYDGLNTAANMPPLVPTQFESSITLNKLPIEMLVELAELAIAQNTATKTAPQAIAQQMMGSVVQKLQEAGTSLVLKNTRLGNNNYTVNLDGVLKSEPSSPIGGVGALNIETTGLNNIMTELQKTPKGSSMAQQLTMFRMISEEKGDKNIAKIILSPQGNISINGKDMSALMGGSAPAQ